MKDLAENGTVKVEWGDFSYDSKYYRPRIYIRWIGFDGNELNILFLTKENAQKLIGNLQQTIVEMDEKEERIQQIIKATNFNKLYAEFEDKYASPYPIQTSREHAFACALKDNLIEPEVYDAAKRYYKGLWNYVGD